MARREAAHPWWYISASIIWASRFPCGTGSGSGHVMPLHHPSASSSTPQLARTFFPGILLPRSPNPPSSSSVLRDPPPPLCCAIPVARAGRRSPWRRLHPGARRAAYLERPLAQHPFRVDAERRKPRETRRRVLDASPEHRVPVDGRQEALVAPPERADLVDRLKLAEQAAHRILVGYEPVDRLVAAAASPIAPRTRPHLLVVCVVC